MSGSAPGRSRRRLGRWVAAGAAAVVLAAWGCTLVPPASFKAVGTPRAGRAMNGRVAIVYSRHYQISLGGLEKLHPFDIRKYAKVYLQLLTDGLIRPEDVFVPEPLTGEQALLVHTEEYLRTLDDPSLVARYLEAPIVAFGPAALVDAGVLDPFRHATGGTLLAARQALRCGVAVNLGGGYHHAGRARGEGFCIYADMPIAIRALQKDGLIRRALVADLDVHQGNGTADCCAGDESVFTFDMHQGDLYPIPKARCCLDVELPAGTGDEEYLALLTEHLPGVFERARPDIVFLQGGCDTLADDPLAGLRMTPEGIVKRDATVIDACVERRVPVVMVLGGGYSPDAWRAQYASVRRTIETHGLTNGRPYPPRDPTLKEKTFTK